MLDKKTANKAVERFRQEVRISFFTERDPIGISHVSANQSMDA
jgi:hypothetical protein